MKKSIYLAFLLVSIHINAQLVVTKGDNTPINNNDIIGFAVTGAPSSLSYKLVNNSNQEIYVKIRCTGLSNTDGSNFEFCFDQCYNSVISGQTYPAGAGAPPYDIIAANSTNYAGFHFLNYNTSSPADYYFRFLQVDANGTQIGTPINFTYRYDSNLSVQDIEKVNTLKGMGIALESNSITNALNFENTQTATIKLYDLTGKVVLQNQLQIGNQTIDVTALNTGIYMANFSNNEGANATIKIVKR